ncbi:hypothetical protein Q5752_003231 [Cryptotrichosporon argae]
MAGGAFFAPAGDDPGSDHAVQWVGTPAIKGPRWAKVPLLTIGMLGIQCVWSIEMGYASPYLLDLGLSKSLMSLVFVAGPLSGLIVQPLIGAYADRSRSSFGRRRPFILVASAVCVVAMMVLGWAREIAGFLGFGSASNSTSTGADTAKRADGGSVLAILLAVVAIYGIDFSVNALMSADRALVVDTLPSDRQEEGSAWAGRMFGFGSVAGFFVGNVDLTPYLPFLGRSQLQILSFLTSAVLAVAHALTSWAVTERVLLRDDRPQSTAGLVSSIKAIWTNMFALPAGIRSVCIIQFFANLGWYPILFFTSIWAADMYKSVHAQGALSDAAYEADAVRSGARALFLQSLVNIITSLGAPLLVEASGVLPRARAGAAYEHLGGAGAGAGASAYAREQPGSATWKRMGETRWGAIRAAARRMLEAFKDGDGALGLGVAQLVPIKGLTLVRLWCFSQAVFASAMAASWFVSSPAGVYAVIAVTGFSWALAQWAPYALLGELVLLDPQDDRMPLSHLARRHSSDLPPIDDDDDGQFVLYDADARDSHDAPYADADADADGDAPLHAPLARPTRAAHIPPADAHDEHVSRPSLSSRTPSRPASRASRAARSARATPDPSADRIVLRHSDDVSDSDDGEAEGGRADSARGSLAFRSASRRATASPDPAAPGPSAAATADKAGLILGIHNVFVVLPQFIITVFASAVFYLLEHDSPAAPSHAGGVIGVGSNNGTLVETADGAAVEVVRLVGREANSSGSPDAVGLIFRVGGVAAAVGAYATYRLARRWAAGRGI